MRLLARLEGCVWEIVGAMLCFLVAYVLDRLFGGKTTNENIDNKFTLDGKTTIPPRVFGHNSLLQALLGTRIGGKGSYKPSGAP